MESYNPNNLAHNEPVFPISEWQEWNDLVGDSYWSEDDDIPPPYIYFLLSRDEKRDTIWKYIDNCEKKLK